MKPLQRILFLALLYSHTQAATVSVTPAQFASTSLDLDSDGQAEFGNLQAQIGGVSYQITVDGMAAGSYVTFPDVTFAGFESRTFTDLTSLSLNSLFSGNFTAPTLINREFNNFAGSGFVDASAPIHAWWAYGTAGSGSSPLSLVGLVIDFTEYFNTGGTAAVDIYYHHYGTFSSGQSSGPITLPITAVPEPTSALLLLLSALAPTLTRHRH